MENSDNQEKEEVDQIKTKHILDNLQCDFFLEKLFNNLHKKKSFELIKYNNQIKERLHLNMNDYRKFCELYSSIEIEILPIKDEYSKFINMKYDDKYYHIYFDDYKEEIKRNYLT